MDFEKEKHNFGWVEFISLGALGWRSWIECTSMNSWHWFHLSPWLVDQTLDRSPTEMLEIPLQTVGARNPSTPGDKIVGGDPSWYCTPYFNYAPWEDINETLFNKDLRDTVMRDPLTSLGKMSGYLCRPGVLMEDAQVGVGLSDGTRDIRILGWQGFSSSMSPPQGKVGSLATIIGRRMGIVIGMTSRDLWKWLLIMRFLWLKQIGT